VVTNIEREHLDFYKDLADIKRTFVRFVNRVPFYGSVVMCLDCPACRAIQRRVKRRLVTYGLETPADFRAKDVQLYAFSSAFTLLYQGKEAGRFSVGMPGVHNVENALATIAVGVEMGMDPRSIEQALATFPGVHRRLERKGEKKGIVVFDDYGHHPTEVRVTVQALRHAYPASRLWVVFQPHRYTRTKFLAQEFGTAFDDADAVVVTGLYAASEPPIPGVSEELILDQIRARGRSGLIVQHVREIDEIPEFLKERLSSGDVVLTCGAGSIWRTGEAILARL
ncbi:MAG: Mur ligase family protein, partial [candidate division WOR-3 bacterium]